MTNKTKLAEMLKKRNPFTPQRQAVTPVNLYAPVVKAPKQVSTLALKHQDTKQVKLQSTKAPKHFSTKAPKHFSTKAPKHFSSYLTEQSLKAIKKEAIETDRKDYEVIQEAVNVFFYYKNKQKP